MATFKANNQDWSLRLDAPTITRVRQECDPEFLQANEAYKTFERVASDPVLLCRVIYLLCEKERKERKIEEENFYLHVLGSGDAIEQAAEALKDAILSFTPPRMRGLLTASAAKNERIRQIATDKALARIQ